MCREQATWTKKHDGQSVPGAWDHCHLNFPTVSSKKDGRQTSLISNFSSPHFISFLFFHIRFPNKMIWTHGTMLTNSSQVCLSLVKSRPIIPMVTGAPSLWRRSGVGGLKIHPTSYNPFLWALHFKSFSWESWSLFSTSLWALSKESVSCLFPDRPWARRAGRWPCRMASSYMTPSNFGG